MKKEADEARSEEWAIAAATDDICQFFESYCAEYDYLPLDKYDYVAMAHDAMQLLDAQSGWYLDSLLPTLEWASLASALFGQMYTFWTRLRHPRPQSAIVMATLQQRVRTLQTLPQPAQRSREWYEQMCNILSSSEVSKIVATPGLRNGLIRSKCIILADPTASERENEEALVRQQMILRERMLSDWGTILEPGSIFIDARGWGKRYEPVAKLVYTRQTGQKLLEFGRLPHSTFKGVGASPDAIEADRCHNVEFKCVVSREINGDIPWEYYCQMQLQMEVCDLPWTSFVESKFSEVELRSDCNTVGKLKGVIWIVTASVDISPSGMFYHYSPPFDTVADITAWEAIQKVPEGWQIQSRRYWTLDVFEIQYVPRNPRWWADMKEQIEQFWTDVAYYRENGCQTITPVPRTKKPNKVQTGIQWDDTLVFDDA